MFRDGGLTKNVTCRDEHWGSDEDSCQRTYASYRVPMILVVGMCVYGVCVHVWVADSISLLRYKWKWYSLCLSALTCGSTVPTVANASASSENTTHQSVVRFTCLSGHSLDNSKSGGWFDVKCNDSADWQMIQSSVTSLNEIPTGCTRTKFQFCH